MNPPRSQDVPPVYTVTIYLAAPGTPLTHPDGSPLMGNDGKQATSETGHMYYSINDGTGERGYGFGPKTSTDWFDDIMGSAGDVNRNEFREYSNPAYARTMEITQEQYEQLRNFGNNSWGQGFSHRYHGGLNSCVDFTWAALDSAGLHNQGPTYGIDAVLRSPFDGTTRVMSNRERVDSIPAPYPRSGLNHVQEHPLPSQTWWQRQLTENNSSPTPDDSQMAQGIPAHHFGNLRDRQHPAHESFLAVRNAMGAMETRLGVSPGPQGDVVGAAVTAQLLRERVSPFELDVQMDRSGILQLTSSSYADGSLYQPRQLTLDTSQALRRTFAEYSEESARTISPYYEVNAQAAVRTPEQIRAFNALPPRDQEMFNAIRTTLPDSIPDDQVAHATLQARRGGVMPDRLDDILLRDQSLYLTGTNYTRANVQMDEPVPSMQASVAMTHELIEQREQQSLLEAQQREQGRAMRMG